MARQPNVYNNARYNSYDSSTSSLSMRYFNTIGAIDLNPINPEFINKAPQKGDKVYDYENKLTVYVSPAMALTLVKGIKQLKAFIENEEDIKSVSSEHGDKKITIYAPGTVKVRANKTTFDTSNNFVIQISNKEDETGVHILQNETVTYTSSDDSVLEDIVYTGLEMLELFLNEIVSLNIYGVSHAVAMVGGSSSGSASSPKKSTAFANISDDDDDDEFEDDEPAVAKTTKKKASKKSLIAEFGDDEDEE